MKIGLDIDGVLADFVTDFAEFYKKEYGKAEKIFTKDDFKSMHFWEVFDCSFEKAVEIVYRWIRAGGPRHLTPEPGAVKGIEEIAKSNELYVISGRQREQESATKEWLDRFFPGKFKRVILTDFYRNGSKVSFCKKADCQFYIEDDVEYATELAKEGIQVMLLTQLWNKDKKLANGIKRFESWSEIESYFSALKSQ